MSLTNFFSSDSSICDKLISCLQYCSYFSTRSDNTESALLDEALTHFEKGLLYKGMIKVAVSNLLEQIHFLKEKFSEFDERFDVIDTPLKVIKYSVEEIFTSMIELIFTVLKPDETSDDSNDIEVHVVSINDDISQFAHKMNTILSTIFTTSIVPPALSDAQLQMRSDSETQLFNLKQRSKTPYTVEILCLCRMKEDPDGGLLEHYLEAYSNELLDLMEEVEVLSQEQEERNTEYIRKHEEDVKMAEERVKTEQDAQKLLQMVTEDAAHKIIAQSEKKINSAVVNANIKQNQQVKTGTSENNKNTMGTKIPMPTKQTPPAKQIANVHVKPEVKSSSIKTNITTKETPQEGVVTKVKKQSVSPAESKKVMKPTRPVSTVAERVAARNAALKSIPVKTINMDAWDSEDDQQQRGIRETDSDNDRVETRSRSVSPELEARSVSTVQTVANNSRRDEGIASDEGRVDTILGVLASKRDLITSLSPNAKANRESVVPVTQLNVEKVTKSDDESGAEEKTSVDINVQPTVPSVLSPIDTEMTSKSPQSRSSNPWSLSPRVAAALTSVKEITLTPHAVPAESPVIKKSSNVQEFGFKPNNADISPVGKSSASVLDSVMSSFGGLDVGTLNSIINKDILEYNQKLSHQTRYENAGGIASHSDANEDEDDEEENVHTDDHKMYSLLGFDATETPQKQSTTVNVENDPELLQLQQLLQHTISNENYRSDPGDNSVELESMNEQMDRMFREKEAEKSKMPSEDDSVYSSVIKDETPRVTITTADSPRSSFDVNAYIKSLTPYSSPLPNKDLSSKLTHEEVISAAKQLIAESNALHRQEEDETVVNINPSTTSGLSFPSSPSRATIMAEQILSSIDNVTQGSMSPVSSEHKAISYKPSVYNQSATSPNRPRNTALPDHSPVLDNVFSFSKFLEDMDREINKSTNVLRQSKDRTDAEDRAGNDAEKLLSASVSNTTEHSNSGVEMNLQSILSIPLTATSSLSPRPTVPLSSRVVSNVDPLSQSVMGDLMASVESECMEDYVTRAYQTIRNRAVNTEIASKWDDLSQSLSNSQYSLPPAAPVTSDSLANSLSNTRLSVQDVRGPPPVGFPPIPTPTISPIVDPLNSTQIIRPPTADRVLGSSLKGVESLSFRPVDISSSLQRPSPSSTAIATITQSTDVSQPFHAERRGVAVDPLSQSVTGDLMASVESECMEDYVARAYQKIRDKAVNHEVFGSLENTLNSVDEAKENQSFAEARESVAKEMKSQPAVFENTVMNNRIIGQQSISDGEQISAGSVSNSRTAELDNDVDNTLDNTHPDDSRYPYIEDLSPLHMRQSQDKDVLSDSLTRYISQPEEEGDENVEVSEAQTQEVVSPLDNELESSWVDYRHQDSQLGDNKFTPTVFPTVASDTTSSSSKQQAKKHVFSFSTYARSSFGSRPGTSTVTAVTEGDNNSSAVGEKSPDERPDLQTLLRDITESYGDTTQVEDGDEDVYREDGYNRNELEARDFLSETAVLRGVPQADDVVIEHDKIKQQLAEFQRMVDEAKRVHEVQHEEEVPEMLDTEESRERSSSLNDQLQNLDEEDIIDESPQYDTNYDNINATGIDVCSRESSIRDETEDAKDDKEEKPISFSPDVTNDLHITTTHSDLQIPSVQDKPYIHDDIFECKVVKPLISTEEQEAIRKQLQSERVLIDYQFFLNGVKRNKRRVQLGHEIMQMLRDYNEHVRLNPAVEKLRSPSPMSQLQIDSEPLAFTDHVLPAPSTGRGTVHSANYKNNSEGIQSVLVGPVSPKPAVSKPKGGKHKEHKENIPKSPNKAVVTAGIATANPSKETNKPIRKVVTGNSVLQESEPAVQHVFSNLATAREGSSYNDYVNMSEEQEQARVNRKNERSEQRQQSIQQQQQQPSLQIVPEYVYNYSPQKPQQQYQYQPSSDNAAVQPSPYQQQTQIQTQNAQVKPPAPHSPTKRVIVIPANGNGSGSVGQIHQAPPRLRPSSATNRRGRASDGPLSTIEEESNPLYSNASDAADQRKERIRAASAGRAGSSASTSNKYTNFQQTKNAISAVCLAGTHADSKRHEVLDLLEYYSSSAGRGVGAFRNQPVIEESMVEHPRLKSCVNQFVIMFYKSKIQTFKGIYALDPIDGSIVRIYGIGPRELPSGNNSDNLVSLAIQGYMKFETASKSFKNIPVKGISSAVDAVILDPTKLMKGAK